MHSSLHRPSFTRVERNASMDLSSLHRMRRASLVQSAHTERSFAEDSSCMSNSFNDDSSSAVSVRFCAKNFVTQRTGTLDSNYHLGELLGAGGFGEVYECTHVDSGAERAVKVLEKSLHRPELNEAVIREFNVLRNLDSPNLLKVYEMYEDATHFYLVTDLYRGGDLFSELEEAGCFSEIDAAVVMNTILSCVNYCHGNGLAHCDLKPENILLDGQDLDDMKIIDFGLAQQFGDPDHRFTAMEGSHYYVSPQLISGSYTAKCDIWAVGVITYVLIAGSAPFDGDSAQDIYDEIVKGVVDFDYDAWDGVSEEAKDFIRCLLAYEEEDRPTAEEALQHPWLQNQRAKILDQSDQRISARQSLLELQSFRSGTQDKPFSKLKEATCAIIVARLLLKEEKDIIDEVFRSLDHSCDGYLDREDLRKGYREYFDVGLSDADLEAVFQQVNVSGTGKIEYSEFAVAMMVQKDMINDKLEAAFKFFDQDDKGYISGDDIQIALSLKEDSKLKHRILKQADQDGDGVVTFSEFRAMMLSSKIQQQQQRRCSIARTPRRGSLAFGAGFSDHSGCEDSLGTSSHSSVSCSVSSQQPFGLNLRRSSRRMSDGMAIYLRRTSTTDTALLLGEVKEEVSEKSSSSIDGSYEDEDA